MAKPGTVGSGGEVVFNVRIDTSQASIDVNSLLSNFRKLELIAIRYLAIARRMGLPEDVQAAVDAIARLIVLIRQAQLAFSLLQTSMGPIGWAAFGASALMLGFSITDTAGSFT